MDHSFISKEQANAALEKALREGWITPEQVETMRSAGTSAEKERPRHSALRRWFSQFRAGRSSRDNTIE